MCVKIFVKRKKKTTEAYCQNDFNHNVCKIQFIFFFAALPLAPLAF